MMNADAILEMFHEEVGELGGRVSDAIADGTRLFARSILPAEARVAADIVKPGVALRYMNDTVEVRPYVHRVVCKNGAVIAHSGLGESIQFGEPLGVRRAIHAAAEPATFYEFVAQMRTARRHRPDPTPLLMALVHRAGFGPQEILDVLERLNDEGEHSLYGIANAVTALARDTRDPVQRWDREAAGAAIFARLWRPVPVENAYAQQPELV